MAWFTRHRIKKIVHQLDENCVIDSEEFKVASIIIDIYFNGSLNPIHVCLRCNCTPHLVENTINNLNQFNGRDNGWISEGVIDVIEFWLYVLMGMGMIGRK